MDSIIARIDDDDKYGTNDVYKAVICPHDDYAYAGGLYSKTLNGIKAKTIVLVGVAHKARNFDLTDKLVFGSFDYWKGVYGNIKVSAFRNELVKKLAEDIYVVHDSMMIIEHSLEAITPFLQVKNKDIEIIPLLVPYMKNDDMITMSLALAKALQEVMQKHNLQYGKDLAIVISNDAVHYGNVDWGGKDMAPFGVDSTGNEKARKMDLEIIKNCLEGEVLTSKVKQFTDYTVQQDDYKEYKWVWCGRYSVPFGLLLANNLNELIEQQPLTGTVVDYRTSLNNKHLKVNDLGMGTTAPANNAHWVGYVGVVYK
ncbi:MAG: AmmeMemoRadiSam system protein B [Chloroflexia bacterium]|nr:AmmeMemoRadiSam system protein B [Chloroflexia bacterium]